MASPQTLTDYEIEVLSHLSAEGVAKLNREMLRGTAFDQTLHELVDVYRQALERQRWIQDHVPKNLAAEFRFLLDRDLTIDEMAVLAFLPREWLDDTICEHLKQGEELDNLIQDLAFEFKHEQLRVDAEALSERHPQLSVTVTRLTATTIRLPDAEQPTLLSRNNRPVLSQIVQTTPQSVRIGFSPIALWFTDAPSPTARTNCSLPRTNLQPVFNKKTRGTHRVRFLIPDDDTETASSLTMPTPDDDADPIAPCSSSVRITITNPPGNDGATSPSSDGDDGDQGRDDCGGTSQPISFASPSSTLESCSSSFGYSSTCSNDSSGGDDDQEEECQQAADWLLQACPASPTDQFLPQNAQDLHHHHQHLTCFSRHPLHSSSSHDESLGASVSLVGTS